MPINITNIHSYKLNFVFVKLTRFCFFDLPVLVLVITLLPKELLYVVVVLVPPLGSFVYVILAFLSPEVCDIVIPLLVLTVVVVLPTLYLFDHPPVPLFAIITILHELQYTIVE